MMKILKIHLAFLMLLVLPAWGMAQVVSDHKATATSTAGGVHEGGYQGGTVTNTYIGGIPAVGTSTGNNGAGLEVTHQAGFLFGVSAPPCLLPDMVWEDLDELLPDQAVFNWTAVNYSLNYLVRYRLSGVQTWTEVTTTDNFLQVTGLEPGMTYQWQMKNVCSADGFYASDYSPLREFTTFGISTCDPPTTVTLVDNADETFNVSWADMTTVQNPTPTYEVQYKLSTAITWSSLSTINTSEIITAMGGMTYFVQVRTLCDGTGTLVSDYSPIQEVFVTGGVGCQVPQNLLASTYLDPADPTFTLSAISFSWDPAPGVQTDPAFPMYEYRYKVAGTTIWTTLGAYDVIAEIPGLEPGTIYALSVRTLCSIDGTVASDYSPIIEVTTEGAANCFIPTGLMAMTVTSDQADIIWDASPEATNFDVNYRMAGTFEWSTFSSVTNNILLSALEAGMTYEVQVNAWCSPDGLIQSGFSEIYSFTTQGLPVCDVPSMLMTMADEVTSTITLSWADSPSIPPAYNLKYRMASSPEWAYVSGITVNSHTLLLDEVELLSGTDYYFSVQADCNGDGSLTSAYAEDYFFSTPGLNACTAPANVQAPLATINETTAQVSWDALAGSPVYEIYYRLTGASTWQSAMTYDAFINLSALVSGMEYQAQVRVFCSGDWSVVSEFSDIITFTTTGIIACEAPTVAGSTPISDTSQGIVFNSPGGGMYYDVKYRVQGIISWSIARSTTGPAITLSNLLPGTPYQVMVRADCSGTGDGSINSDYSSIYTFITSGTSTCVGPQGIAVSSITDTGATVSWGVGTGALSYDMRYRLKGSTAWTTVSGPETQVVLSGLESGMTYQVQARSLCNVDATLQSVWSTTLEFTTTGTPACDVPIGLTASSITDTGANITWTVANGAQEYEVRYRVSGTYTWTITATPSASISLNGLATGMPYQLRVRSICNADGSLLSGFSDIFSFSTTGAAACAIPTSLVANNITEQSTDLTWSPASGAVEYEVRYRPSGTTLWESINTATNTLTLSGLLPSEEYQWRVRTICSTDGTLASQFSTVSTFLTTAPPPVAPPAGRSEGDETVTAVDDTESKEVVQLLTTPLLNVYPNPFRHTLYFEYTPVEDEDITLLIFHLNGKKVAEVFSGKVWAQQQLRFSFVPQNLPKGMYIYRLISDKGPGMTSRIVLN